VVNGPEQSALNFKFAGYLLPIAAAAFLPEVGDRQWFALQDHLIEAIAWFERKSFFKNLISPAGVEPPLPIKRWLTRS
jgi:hypothetical protein